MLIKTSVSFGQSELDKLVDAWHLAASNASFDSYFEVVTDDFVFLGTAPGERWTKDQFAAFSKPYFDKGKAWDFKASNRNWNYSSNGKTAWFDEDLDTWMRGCRGSGVLVKKKGKWKIAYYNLTVLIENEKMKSFIELRDATLD
jgi:ketosteroid isomerase-like protein